MHDAGKDKVNSNIAFFEPGTYMVDTTYRLARVHNGNVALQLLHSPVEEAVDGLVIVLLVGCLDDQGDRTVNCP